MTSSKTNPPFDLGNFTILTTLCNKNAWKVCGNEILQRLLWNSSRWWKRSARNLNWNESFKQKVFQGEFRNISRTWIQVQACRPKINITFGCLQHLDIQKNWDEDLQSVVWRRLQEVGWSCLHIQRELSWVPGDLPIVTKWTWGEKNLLLFDSQLFDSLLSPISDGINLENSRGEIRQS